MSSNEPIVIDKNKSKLLLRLPPANTKRWVARRKAAVVLATRAGVISREEAYERYALSPEELAAWEAAFDQDGIRSLRITHLQDYRRRGRKAARAGAAGKQATVSEGGSHAHTS